jgi:hypothetical protein
MEYSTRDLEKKLYLIGCEDSRLKSDYAFCKIGIAKDPAKRIYVIRTHSPLRLYPQKIWDQSELGKMSAPHIEIIIKRKFRESPAHGSSREWFQIDPAYAELRIQEIIEEYK